MRIKMKDCRAVALHVYPGESGVTQVLEVSGLLTPGIAEKLQCREASYTEEGIPRNFDSYPSPSLRIDGAVIVMNEQNFSASLLHKFKVVKPKAKGQQGVSLELSVRIHFGGEEPVKPWLETQNNATFVLDISARQEDLAFGEREADDEVDAGDPAQADMDSDTGCTSCNAGNPMGMAGYHLNGQKCVNPAKEATPEPQGALASAQVAVGGTHQKTSRRNRPPRNPEQEAIADGSADEPVN